MPTPTALPLDHLVINARFEIDAAASVFSQLGFTVTPRGRHPMGSVNNLIIFEHDYLELIGLPTDGGPLRQEMLDGMAGINGVVYRPESADAVHAALTAQGLPILPLHPFTRPVELDGQIHQASFRTVRFAPSASDGGRVYYCEHLTPELVWRPEWQSHPNTACGQSGLTVITSEPEQDARRHAVAAFSEAIDAGTGHWQVPGPDFVVDFVTADVGLKRFAGLACQPLGRVRFFGAITLQITDPDAIRRHVTALGSRVVHQSHADGVVVFVPDLNALLDFRAGTAA